MRIATTNLVFSKIIYDAGHFDASARYDCHISYGFGKLRHNGISWKHIKKQNMVTKVSLRGSWKHIYIGWDLFIINKDCQHWFYTEEWRGLEWHWTTNPKGYVMLRFNYVKGLFRHFNIYSYPHLDIESLKTTSANVSSIFFNRT